VAIARTAMIECEIYRVLELDGEEKWKGRGLRESHAADTSRLEGDRVVIKGPDHSSRAAMQY
jgi:hypothetical protein